MCPGGFSPPCQPQPDGSSFINETRVKHIVNPVLTAEERKLRRSYLLRREARNKRFVAWHEAAHCVVMSHYGLGYQGWLEPPIDGRNGWSGGQCSIGRYKPSLFQRAVVAWAGSIVDYLSGWPLEEWRKVSRVPFESVEIPRVKWWEKKGDWLMRRGYWEGDLDGVVGTRQKWRALKLSWEIVVDRRIEIVAMAEMLMKKREGVTVLL